MTWLYIGIGIAVGVIAILVFSRAITFWMARRTAPLVFARIEKSLGLLDVHRGIAAAITHIAKLRFERMTRKEFDVLAPNAYVQDIAFMLCTEVISELGFAEELPGDATQGDLQYASYALLKTGEAINVQPHLIALARVTFGSMD